MFEELLSEIARALDEAGLPYMIFGGQAVLLYGEPRLTRDIDVTLDVDTSRAPDLLHLIKEKQWRILVERPEEFVCDTLVVPALDPKSGIRIDFVFSLTDFERQAIDRSRVVPIAGVDVRFVSLEDLIVMKTISGRPRDLEDVVSVIRKNPGFNRDEVEKWLSVFDADLDQQFSNTFAETLFRARPQSRGRKS